MKLFICLTIAVSTFLIGITLSVEPRFTQTTASSFKSSGSMPHFMNNCPECGEIGNIEITHAKLSPKRNPYYNIEFRCGDTNKNLAERRLNINEKGEVIGVRCLSSSQNYAEIFWTEGDNFWLITASSFTESDLELSKVFEDREDFWMVTASTFTKENLELVKEFERSKEFRSWKSQSQ